MVYWSDTLDLLDEAAVVAVLGPRSAHDDRLLLVLAAPNVILDQVFAHNLYPRISQLHYVRK